MADQKKRISELPSSGTNTQGLHTIGVNAQNESVKVPLGDILAGYDQAEQNAATALQTAQNAATAAAAAQSKANSVENSLTDYVTNQALIDAFNAVPQKNVNTQRIYQIFSPFVNLASMGSDLDNVDGGNFAYVGQQNDAWYNPSNKKIYLWWEDAAEAVYYNPSSEVAYYNAHTGRMYRWNGADMVENSPDLTKLADTLEFAGVLETATVLNESTTKKSTDNDAQVFYIADIKRFVLGVRNATQYIDQQNVPMLNSGGANLERVVIGNVQPYTRLTDEQIAELANDLVVFNGFYTYYENWGDRELYANESLVPLSGKAFICTSTDVLYYWKSSASMLKPMGKDYSSEVAELQTSMSALQSSVAPRLFFNGNVLTNREGTATTLAQFLAVTANSDDYAHVRKQGVVITLYTAANTVKSYQWKGTTWDDASKWKEFGGSAAVGNCYNVTNEVPKAMGYYDLQGAINATYANDVAAAGMQITFAIAEGSWKTYQYVGADTEETNFKNTANWIDLAGMSAGSEPVLNVNELCGAPSAGGYYTLSSARNAIAQMLSKTGIDYRKQGLVITYMVGNNKWETKQFNGSSVSDFAQDGLWEDFGGAGTEIELSDTPAPATAQNPAKAFSTQGAYDAIPTDLRVDDSDEGTVKIAMVNAAGDVVGNEAQFTVGTGSGEASGTIVTFVPQYSPLYAKAGGNVILNASVRSITKTGGGELYNPIESVDLYDRDTNQLLQTFVFAGGKPSSADNETFDFEFDLSSFFTQASSRKFRFVATDDSGKTGSRNVNVNAVDVTIVSTQTLNYTPTTVLNVGGSGKVLDMYKFPNNKSNSGIRCTTEIFLNGSWQTLGTAVVTNSYSQSIAINPNNCLGVALQHGAYPLRIHGEDIDAGVVGNYLYTAVMVIDPNNTTPIVVSRYYTETLDGRIKQYQSITVEYAAFCNSASSVNVDVYKHVGAESTLVQSTAAARQSVYTYETRVAGVATDGTVTLGVSFTATVAGVSATTPIATYVVFGSVVDIQPVTTQLVFDKDFSGRSNADSGKTLTERGGYIIDTEGGYNLEVFGCNFSTNGFVKDSFGTSQYNTDGDTGLMALRIAENVTAECNYKPFNVAGIEQNGMAIQFRIRTKNIADETARLISCISGGVGFFVMGKMVVFTTNNAPELYTSKTDVYTIKAELPEDTIVDVAIVVEPPSQAPFAGVGIVKMYFDGELIASCIYDTGDIVRHATPITFDGTSGDLYVYNIRAWETYFSYEQSFDNYLLKMADTSRMIEEHQFNQVMSSQAAEGKPASNRPQARSGNGHKGLFDIGIPYFVLCKNARTANTDDQYPEYLETLDGDKKTKRTLDVYAYFPDRPWQNFKAIGVTVTNQGTTSSQRPIKNIKMKFKDATITLLNNREDFSGEEQLLYDQCAANAARHRVQVRDTSLPTNIITVKVDYSDSGGAHNGASAHLYNDMMRILGEKYMTPAQIAYTGTYELNCAIDSVPCAFFRTDKYSADATSPSYGYFHAKGNWNFDKGDPRVFGFEDVPGYNEDCINYGDFVEIIAQRGQTLANLAATVDKTDWIEGQIYVLSEFCGAGHKIFEYVGGAWVENTGTMEYINGQWRVEGLVVNPVENYEIKTYDALAWFQGVNSVDDMLRRDQQGKPIWLTYFESRYPDNDELNQAYEDGLKVPYRLYEWLRWCQQCNHNLTDDAAHNSETIEVDEDGETVTVEKYYGGTNASTTITIDGVEVAGTKANRLKKFVRELHKVANVHSVASYHVTTDYFNAVDQRSKNMMVGFYLEKDGTVRMYLNHWYDGDCLHGSDNDCGLTIPAELDPNNDPNGFFQGHDSVLFNQLAASNHIWLTDYASDADTEDSNKTTTVAAIAKEMRENATSPSGLRVFSPQGIEYYWITLRLSKYPKLVSGFDGLRKYVERSTAAKNYVYALHGLSIQRLRDYVERRFRFRDGYYGCGDNLKSHIDMRCVGINMSVTIKAAKAGYFALGVDRTTAADIKETVYLNAGESATLHSGSTNRGGGIMLYVYGADRIAELDLTNAAPKQSGWAFDGVTLLEKLVLGGENYHVPTTIEGSDVDGLLNSLNLGEMPFLQEVDVRNFPLSSINASHCPRLTTVRALGSNLQSFTPAETSPLETLQLPATMRDLVFVNLPNLTYPNGGLTVGGYSNVTKLQVSGCPNIDVVAMLQNAINGGAAITDIGISGLDVTADVGILQSLMASGAKGFGSDADYGCDGITGRWISASYISDETLAALQAYFHSPSALAIHNAQYTAVVFDDTQNDPRNVTNLDNNTTGANYVASGHITKIRSKLIPVKGKVSSGVFHGVRLSNDNYRKLANGDDFDYQDLTGNNFDVFMRCPALWYKGVNDFKNQRKYIFWSSLSTEPLSTCKSAPVRKTLSQILLQENVAVFVNAVTEGESTLDSNGVVATYNNYNIYQMNVEGMKQVRFPGVNLADVGAAFLDAEGVIIDTFNMAISTSDFVNGEYLFVDVPADAQTFVFTSHNDNASLECIAVDSSEIEAIEPDWVYNAPWLGGVYEASVDGILQLRSISNATVKVGRVNSNSKTNVDWTYDTNGNPTNTPTSTMDYTYKDFQNLARRRGTGYQLFDYEMSKLMAILYYSLTGNRDAQLLCGYGQNAGGTTGYRDTLGNADSVRGVGSGNKCLGFESFFGCTFEWIDNVLVNVSTFENAYKAKVVANNVTDQQDAVWHIYDPIAGTERTVKGIQSDGVNIARVRHGRYCDVIASKLIADSNYATYYCDRHYQASDRCRVVGRANNNSYANGGLAYAYAVFASSNAFSDIGSRLAFRGEIVIDDE